MKPYIGFSPPLTRKEKFGIAFIAPLTLLVIVMAVFIGVSEYLWVKIKRRVKAACGKGTK